MQSKDLLVESEESVGVAGKDLGKFPTETSVETLKEALQSMTLKLSPEKDRLGDLQSGTSVLDRTSVEKKANCSRNPGAFGWFDRRLCGG
jgi:hypothetical protein